MIDEKIEKYLNEKAKGGGGFLDRDKLSSQSKQALKNLEAALKRGDDVSKFLERLLIVVYSDGYSDGSDNK